MPIEEKIARLQGESQHLAPDAKNKNYNSAYVSYEQLMDHLRGRLAELNMAWTVEVDGLPDAMLIDEETKSGVRQQEWFRAEFIFQLTDTSDGSSVALSWIGEAKADVGMGFAQAATTACRTFWMKLLGIGTTASHQRHETGQSRPRRDTATTSRAASSNDIEWSAFYEAVNALSSDEKMAAREAALQALGVESFDGVSHEQLMGTVHDG